MIYIFLYCYLYNNFSTLSVRLFVCPSVRPPQNISLFVCPSVCPPQDISLFVCPSVRPPIKLFVYLMQMAPYVPKSASYINILELCHVLYNILKIKKFDFFSQIKKHLFIKDRFDVVKSQNGSYLAKMEKCSSKIFICCKVQGKA